MGSSVGMFGARVGQVAVTLVAVTELNSDPLAVGLLSAANNVGLLLIGLPAGAWVDRMRRRRLMVSMDLLRAVLLATIPLAGWLDVLTLAHLILVALLVGFATVFFDVAHLSFLPTLVEREQLLDGNAKLQASQSVAAVSGPAVGGGLVALVGGSNALLTTCAGFLGSALAMKRIGTPEPEPRRSDEPNLRSEVMEGLRALWTDSVLRALAGCTASLNLFMAVALTLNVLFLTREIGLSTEITGLVLASGGLGGIIGALIGKRVVALWGTGRAVWIVLLCTQPFSLLLPLTGLGWSVTPFVLGWMAVGHGTTIYNVAQITIRQTICTERLLGRVNASNRVVVWSMLPVGSLLGGLLAQLMSVRGGLWIAGTGLTLSVLCLVFSPLRTGEFGQVR